MKKIFSIVTVFSLLAVGIAYADGLTIQKALFADQVVGLGQYTPHAGNRFTLDDTCRVYVEVAGFATPLTLNTQDEYNVNMGVDVRIKLPQSGRRIAFQPDMAKLDTKLRSKLAAHFFAFAFNFDGWSPGSYVLEVGVRDNLGGQTVSQDIPFVLAEPTAAEIRARQEQQPQEQQPAEEPQEQTAPR